MNPFVRSGYQIGKLVQEKNAAYGNSFAVAGDFLRLLYPNGLNPDQYADALLLVRIFDKQMRIATNRDALGESPYRDIAGYGILGASIHESPNHSHGDEDLGEASKLPASMPAPRLQETRKKPSGKVLRKHLLHAGLPGTKRKEGPGEVSALRRKHQEAGKAK